MTEKRTRFRSLDEYHYHLMKYGMEPETEIEFGVQWSDGLGNSWRGFYQPASEDFAVERIAIASRSGNLRPVKLQGDVLQGLHTWNIRVLGRFTDIDAVETALGPYWKEACGRANSLYWLEVQMSLPAKREARDRALRVIK